MLGGIGIGPQYLHLNQSLALTGLGSKAYTVHWIVCCKHFLVMLCGIFPFKKLSDLFQVRGL